MKSLLVALALAVGAAFALQEKPVNTTCPIMKGKAVKPGITSVYDGKTVAFCCTKCKKLWDKDPKEYAGNLPPTPAAKGPIPAQIGKGVPDFELTNVEGRTVKFTGAESKFVILQWIDPASPASERLAASGVMASAIKKIGDMADEFAHYSIYSGAAATPPDVAKFLKDRKVESEPLIDADFKAARTMGAKTSSHVFVIYEGILRYSGAIDNDPDGKKGEKAENYLVSAVDAILKKKKVSPETTSPYGTALKGK